MSFLSRVVYLLGLCLFTSIKSHIQIDLVVENQDGNSGVVPEQLIDEGLGNLDTVVNNLVISIFLNMHFPTVFHKHLQLIQEVDILKPIILGVSHTWNWSTPSWKQKIFAQKMLSVSLYMMMEELKKDFYCAK